MRKLFLVTFASLFGATTALAAPTVELTPQPTPLVVRVDTNGNPYSCPTRNSASASCIVDGTTQGIGFHDCTDDTSLRFSLAMSGVPDSNYTLQIWAGTTDCTQPGATNSASTGTCWKVAQDPTMSVVVSPVDVRVADLVSGLGVKSPAQTYTAANATSACGQAKTIPGVTIVTLYFMVFGNGNAAPVSSATYAAKVKLVGPDAVSGVTASAGDGAIVLDWTPPTNDPTLQGFDLFAVPKSTSCSSLDVAAIACPSAACQPLIGAEATSGSVTGLDDGTTYTGAVVAFDEYGNDSPVSQAACATPKGGTLSGGCACDATGAANDPRFTLAWLGLAALVASRRIHRSRSRRSSFTSTR